MTARRERGRGRWPNNGGVSQLSSAFDVFAAAHPERAFAIVDQLDPTRQCHVAGGAVRALAAVKTIEPQRIVHWIRKLNAKGFDGRVWRRELSWALRDIACRTNGLDNDEIELLESWMLPYEPPKPLITDYKLPASKEKTSERQRAHPVIFGHGWGFGIVTQGNFNMLSAIHQGLLLRPEPQCDTWLAVLERHLKMPEDSEVWASVLDCGEVLFRADKDRVAAFLHALWTRYPEAFAHPKAIPFTWSCRDLMPSAIIEGLLRHWLKSEDDAQQQMAGEYATALLLLGEGTIATDEVARGIIEGGEAAAHLGSLFAAAAAWREDDPALRGAAHSVLSEALPCANEDAAEAIASAVDRRTALPPDDRTRAMLALIGKDPLLLEATLKGSFADLLQKLLLYPGFEEDVLAFVERAASAELGADSRRVRVGDELVAISIALQRGDGQLRVRAMDLYERLLDADAYGAEQAAVAALRA